MTDIPTGPRPSPGKEKGFVLLPHPDFPSRAIQSISVDVEREADGNLLLKYRVTGAIEEVLWPSSQPQSSGPTDRLWEHSCFEAFVGRPDEPGYIELNATTALEWALYAFDDYRTGMRDVEATIETEIWRESNDLQFSAKIKDDIKNPALVGLTAVIEETDGQIRYWSTAFAPGKPDFHAAAVRSLLFDGVSAE